MIKNIERDWQFSFAHRRVEGLVVFITRGINYGNCPSPPLYRAKFDLPGGETIDCSFIAISIEEALDSAYDAAIKEIPKRINKLKGAIESYENALTLIDAEKAPK